MSITSLRKKTEEAQAQYDQNLTKCGKKLEKQNTVLQKELVG